MTEIYQTQSTINETFMYYNCGFKRFVGSFTAVQLTLKVGTSTEKANGLNCTEGTRKFSAFLDMVNSSVSCIYLLTISTNGLHFYFCSSFLKLRILRPGYLTID